MKRSTAKRCAAVLACSGLLAMVCVGAALGDTASDIDADATAPAMTTDQIDIAARYCDGSLNPDGHLLVNAHRDLGITCSGCHTAATDSEPGTRGFCMRSGCHGDWESIVEATADWKGTVTVYNASGTYNPHDNHRGDANCSDCHSMHGQQDLTCVTCHNMDVPEGWKGYR